ncbi:hypothetical protein UFOVP724_115 [uncultured Caudovirales phage]|uniref:Uncharacterized protein n=1 Tax=uncultured Caudovirales phage TaxID=2100421 RepID=A0A6J5NSF8_9CAUD|nr:hypothetical protein UFOVP724_115 [uncultured Caudovirales phage]
MTWVNKKNKSTTNSARIFDINETAIVDNIIVNQNALSTEKLNQKFLVAEIYTAVSTGYGNIVDPYTEAPIITISNSTTGNTYYNQSSRFQIKNLQTKNNIMYSKIDSSNSITKTISLANGASLPQLITRIITRVTI